ncbi:phytoene desaturase [Rhodobacteraceae bacterium N5(2021)]|uniref:Phytoene dehydrogenase n=1 Tax=Gymnodinialimonas phycosphaerae TaxID=2841589 RepID=A0A975TSK7_9RHOB|nr:phytoene desaturase [Gymnodinialimonas phycosphaerae]MBY4894215.1 phytoene desaturase [Gymnodinialimonas phycosphaerae]
MKNSNPSRAIVIGAGLGGLSAAMRLGAKGYRVTVLDRLDRAGGRGSSITQNGHRFDLGPTIVTVPQVFEQLWADCGRDFRAEVDLWPVDPYYEIRWRDGSTFRVNGDDTAMEAEVARLSPADVPGYRKFLRDSETRYQFGFEGLGRRPMNKLMDLVKELPGFVKLRADKSVYAHAASRVKDERLRMALSFHPLFIGGDPTRVTSMYILVSHLEKEFGVHYAMGGVQAMADAMVRVIEDQGGEVRLNEDVAEITVKQGRTTGVVTEEGEALTSDIVVSNADPGTTYEHLLSKQTKKRWTPKRLNKSRWSMGLFVWYFGTKGTRDQWADVGHHTILNGPRYNGLLDDIFIRRKLADDMSIYLHRPSVTDPTAAPEGDDTFYALSPVPNLHGKSVDWAEMTETYRANMAKVLNDQMLPGFEDHLSASHIFTPQTFVDRYRSPFGAGFSLEPRIFQSAWFRPHNVSEEIAGLYLVGAGTHPGAGIPSVVTSSEVLNKLVPEARNPVIPPVQRLAAE